MDYTGYISEVVKYPHISLTDADRFYLERIQASPKSSYDLFVSLSRTNPAYLQLYGVKKIAYKNVWQGIHKLVTSKLIKEMDSSKLQNEGIIGLNIHRARYFGLTSFGIFYVLYRVMADIQCLIYYSEDIILETLLYRFFDKKTIHSHTTRLIFALINYLSQCCQLTLYYANEIRLSTGEQKKSNIRRFGSEHEFKAKLLVFELVTRNDTIGSQRQKTLDNRNIEYLLGDKKFMRLFTTVKNEWDDKVFGSK